MTDQYLSGKVGILKAPTQGFFQLFKDMMCQMSCETRGFLIRPPSQCIGGGGSGGGGGLFWKKVPLASESLGGYTFERWGGVGGCSRVFREFKV